jgi:hypothetical protein
MRLLTSNIWSFLAICPNVQRKPLAAGACTLLQCNRNRPAPQAATGDLRNAFLRFKPRANPGRGLLR